MQKIQFRENMTENLHIIAIVHVLVTILGYLGLVFRLFRAPGSQWFLNVHYCALILEHLKLLSLLFSQNRLSGYNLMPDNVFSMVIPSSKVDQ